MTALSSIRRHGKPKRRQSLVLPPFHPANRGGRSIFPSRVFDPDEVGRVLKDGHQSRKIGKTVQKGKRKGWPIYTLTLEERATCPRSCKAWSFCYGNHMQAAERIVAGPELEAQLWGELTALQREHPCGFMVRLHVLGDFYSEDYVALWWKALDAFSALHVFGFTAHQPGNLIGDALGYLIEHRWDRFAIRVSGIDRSEKASVLEGDEGSADPIPCPAQTDKTDCCATCALCWHSTRSIAFARH